MSRDLSNNFLSELFSQNSGDPFLTLVTLYHDSFSQDISFVNNTEDIISNGITYLQFPMKITLPTDDGETAREVAIEFDNVSQEIIDELRTITDYIGVKIQMVLASDPDHVEIEIDELKIRDIFYDKFKISAKLFSDDFLNTELSSERYTPANFPGIFS